MKYYKKIIGEKCYLSPVSGKNAELVVEWSNNPEVTINTGDISDMITIEKQKSYLEYISEHGYGFLIISTQNNKPIGLCKLTQLDKINRKAYKILQKVLI